MLKKIIVLFLLVGTSVFILPSQSQAEVVNEPTNIAANAAPGTALLLPQNRKKRWRNGRWWNRKKRGNNRGNSRWNNRWSYRRDTPRNNNNRNNNGNNNRRNNRRN